MNDMGLHILSHGEGYKGVLQAKQTKIAYRYTIDVVQVYRAKVKFVVTA